MKILCPNCGRLITAERGNVMNHLRYTDVIGLRESSLLADEIMEVIA